MTTSIHALDAEQAKVNSIHFILLRSDDADLEQVICHPVSVSHQ